MNTEDAKTILKRALLMLLNNDLKTFGKNIGERPIMCRIAHYMVGEGAEKDGLTVDCDYNRHGDILKKYLWPPKAESIEGAKLKRFFPDIVLHMRRDNSQNILVCEIKKKGDGRGSTDDHKRLSILTKQEGGNFCYDLGAFIEVDQASRTVKVRYFTCGKPTSKIWDLTIP